MDVVAAGRVGLSEERLARIGPVMQAYVDEGKLPGVITLVARQGQVARFECFGMMDVEASKSMRADAILRIYSMTKPIASVAAMMLYEEAHFQLDDPVSRFIPAFKDVQVLEESGGETRLVAPEREITIHDLMCHTAGLAFREGMWAKDNTLEEGVREQLALPLVRQPGSLWEYSHATNVLGYVIELISGEPLDRFLKERIFDPLGMADTGFYVPPDQVGRLAAVYSRSESGELERADSEDPDDFTRPPRMCQATGGLVSTAADYLRFCRMMLNRGELDGVRLLGRKTVETMTVNHLPDRLLPIGFPDWTWHGYGFGLGVSVVTNAAQSQVLQSDGAYGWAGWASTHFWIDPREALIGMILTQLMPIYTYPIEAQFKTLVYQALVD